MTTAGRLPKALFLIIAMIATMSARRRNLREAVRRIDETDI